MISDDIQTIVKDWYSQPWVFKANSCTYPKSPDYIDCKLLDVPSMVTGKEVLNLGCCYPSDEMQFSETAKTWVAIDISPQIIDRCREIISGHNLWFLTLDMSDMFIFSSGDVFDTVIDFSSGDHLTEEKYKLALKEIYRVLRPNGNFVMTYANLDSFPERSYFGDFGYFRATSQSEMNEWVSGSGFKIVKEINDGDRIGLVAKK